MALHCLSKYLSCVSSINSLHAGLLFVPFCRLLTFFKINFFQKFFQEHYQNVKQFGSRSVLMFCRSLSGSELFANVISRQKVTASKERVKRFKFVFAAALI